MVPLSFRTDGSWIWTDAVSYFLRTYALSPMTRCWRTSVRASTGSPRWTRSPSTAPSPPC